MMPHLVRSIARHYEMVDPDLYRLAKNLVQRIVNHVAAAACVVIGKWQITADDRQQPVAIRTASKGYHRARAGDGTRPSTPASLQVAENFCAMSGTSGPAF